MHLMLCVIRDPDRPATAPSVKASSPSVLGPLSGMMPLGPPPISSPQGVSAPLASECAPFLTQVPDETTTLDDMQQPPSGAGDESSGGAPQADATAEIGDSDPVVGCSERQGSGPGNEPEAAGPQQAAETAVAPPPSAGEVAKQPPALGGTAAAVAKSKPDKPASRPEVHASAPKPVPYSRTAARNEVCW